MATIDVIKQPTYSISASTNSGSIGSSFSVYDFRHVPIISIIATERGIAGCRGLTGSGYRFISDYNNHSLYVESSGGLSNTLYLYPSGSIQLGFNKTSNTITIGSEPFQGTTLLPLSVGGTNNAGNYDINYLLSYDGSKFVSSNINSTTFENILNSGFQQAIGDGATSRITYRSSDILNIVGGSGISVGYNNTSKTTTISSSGIVLSNISGLFAAGSGIGLGVNNNKLEISCTGITFPQISGFFIAGSGIELELNNNKLKISATGSVGSAGMSSIVSQIIFG